MGVHFFGTKKLPEPDFWGAIKPEHVQVHGVKIQFLEQERQICGEVDGFLAKNFPVGIRTADCVPLLLSHEDGEHVGALHSGWKGTLSNILRQFFFVSEASQQASAWSLMIGPSIRACCYQVSADRKQLFQSAYPEVPHGQNLDLVSVIQFQAKQLRLKQIELHPSCTLCDNRFFSHRRGDTGRQWSIVTPSSQLERFKASQTETKA